MKKRYYFFDNENYSVNELVKLTKLSDVTVRYYAKKGVNSITELKAIYEKNSNYRKGQSRKKKRGVNYESSMMNDKNGHWKLLSNVLGC